MDGTITVQGRQLSEQDLQTIRNLIAAPPKNTRRAISRELCAMWNWTTLTGELKDMACRTMLQKLHDRGHITLPLARSNFSARGKSIQPVLDFVSEQPSQITGQLDELTPLRVSMVSARTADAWLLHDLLATHHYLGFRTTVGETIGYLVRDRQDRPVACAVFGAAAWKTAPRDSFIGWDAELRAKRLSGIVNNNRYLILPWVQTPHLASHILGLLARRIRNDWMLKYGHPVALLETFVDRSRFRGTCYRAANWQCVGQTQGRSRQDRYSDMSVPIKDIYLYPLTAKFRQELKG
jgi:hypothetical protein